MKAFFDMTILNGLGYLALLLLIGVFLRAKVNFLQKFLVPACMIGGVIGALILNTTGVPGVDVDSYKQLAYHLFTLSFICLGLRGMGDPSDCCADNSNMTKEMLRGSMWQGLIFYVSFCAQILIATFALYIINFVTGHNYFEAIGFLAGQGFTSGPGTALSSGLLWEKYGHFQMADLGLAFAGMGFIAAFAIGIPLVRWGLQRRLNTFPLEGVTEEIETGLLNKDNQSIGSKQTTQSANVDSLAFHIALVLATWFIAHFITELIATNVSENIGGTLWGFLFFVGMLVGMGLRKVIKAMGYEHLIDSGTMTRITGLMVEFLLLCTLVSITFALLAAFWIPIVVISVVLCVFSLWFSLYFGRRIACYSFERTVMLYGTITGTIPTGLLLLRMVDNSFKTTVSVEAGLSNCSWFALFYVNLSIHGYAVYGWSMATNLAVFAATTVGLIIIMKLMKLIQAKQY